MKTFNVEAVKSVDGIAFGTTRKEVRAHFGADYREIKKSKLSKNTMDVYSSCHVFYTPEDVLEAVEIFPESKVVVNGQAIPAEYDAAVKWLKDMASDVEVDGDGATSAELGISLYAPNGRIESIMTADEKYFA